jgi:hypothetical protein
VIEALLTHWNAADADTRRAGRRWYDSAEAEARAIAVALPERFGPVTAAGILAALSPRAQWSVNVRWAWAVARGRERAYPPAVGLPDARAKAWRIAHGERPSQVLGGPKVRAFWRAIAGDRDAAVIDIWMLRAMGIDQPSVKPAQYERCAEALREAARRVRVPTRDFQATVWMQVRGVKPTDPAGFRPAAVRG